MNGRIYVSSTPEYVMSVGEIRAAEAEIIRDGISESELIERAADALFDSVKGLCAGKRTLIVCGCGNNGSDGLSLALKLHYHKYDVSVITVGSKRNSENLVRYKIAAEKGLVTDRFAGADIIVDALFGIGLMRPPSGEYLETIRRINSSGAYIVSVDIPSGLDGNTGRILSEAVYADTTVTFTAIKRGMVLGDGLNCAGSIELKNIGIKASGDCLTGCLELYKRKRVTHKGDYGRVFIIAGSRQMPGAAIIAARGVLYSGAGYVTLCVPESLCDVFSARIPEVMLKPLPDKNGAIVFDKSSMGEIAEKADSILIGNGLGRNSAVADVIEFLFKNFTGTLIVDADGLNAMAARQLYCSGAKCKIVLTPHIGELYRLTDNTGDVYSDAVRLASKNGCTVAAKSAATVITDGNKTYFNVTGCAGMAKGGSGDALAGIIAALGAYNDSLLSAALGCCKFGLAGETAEEKYGQEAVTASRILDELRF